MLSTCQTSNRWDVLPPQKTSKAGEPSSTSGARVCWAKLKLPAVASPKTDGDMPEDGSGRRTMLIIVQAEIDESGNTLYGVIGDGSARVAKPEELTNIRPIKIPSLFE